MHIAMGNTIDIAWLKGNAIFTGDGNLPGVEIHVQNTFHQLTLSPDKRYIFQHENNSDTTIILDDLSSKVYCDRPIDYNPIRSGHLHIYYIKRNNLRMHHLLQNTHHCAIYI